MRAVVFAGVLDAAVPCGDGCLDPMHGAGAVDFAGLVNHGGDAGRRLNDTNDTNGHTQEKRAAFAALSSW